MFRKLILVGFFSLFTYSYPTSATLIFEDTTLHSDDSIVGSARSVLSEFLNEMEAMKAPTHFVEQTVDHLRGIVFKNLPEGTGAAYNPRTKEIYLGFDLKDPRTGQLKKTIDLGEGGVSTIYHELWHCYFDNIAKPRNTDLYRNWLNNASGLYRSNGMEIHEEAYGVFVEKTILQYVRIRRIMEKKTPENRERLRNFPQFVAIYEDAFNEVINGYYYDSWRREIIYSHVNLPQSDRQNILNGLYLNEMSTKLKDAFSEDKFTHI